MKKKITYKASVRLRPPGPTLFPGVMLFTLFGGTQDADLYRQQYFDRPPDLKEYFGVFFITVSLSRGRLDQLRCNHLTKNVTEIH